jgi:hypothetical protein
MCQLILVLSLYGLQGCKSTELTMCDTQAHRALCDQVHNNGSARVIANYSALPADKLDEKTRLEDRERFLASLQDTGIQVEHMFDAVPQAVLTIDKSSLVPFLELKTVKSYQLDTLEPVNKPEAVGNNRSNKKITDPGFGLYRISLVLY